jgi:hypothetical protein
MARTAIAAEIAAQAPRGPCASSAGAQNLPTPADVDDEFGLWAPLRGALVIACPLLFQPGLGSRINPVLCLRLGKKVLTNID